MRNMKAILFILVTSSVITGLFLQSPVIAQDFILVDFVTGDVGLPGKSIFGDRNVNMEVRLRGHDPLIFDNVNDDQPWDKYSEHVVRKELPENLTFDDFIDVHLSTAPGWWDLFGDNWYLDRFSVQLRLGDQYRLAFIESGAPLARFTRDKTDHYFQFPSPPSIVLRVQFVTGSENLRGGNYNVDLIALLSGGGQIRFDNVNGRQSWDENSEHVVYRNLWGGLNPSDITGVRLETTFPGSDKWNLDRLSARTLLTDNPLDQHREASGNPLFQFTYTESVYDFPFQ